MEGGQLLVAKAVGYRDVLKVLDVCKDRCEGAWRMIVSVLEHRTWRRRASDNP